MTRIKEHAAVVYPRDRSGFADPPPDPVSGLFSALEGTCIEISPDRIYSELVPFGPAFHGIQGNLPISEQGVIAKIGTPAAYASQSISEILGFAFSAGCGLSWRLCVGTAIRPDGCVSRWV